MKLAILKKEHFIKAGQKLDVEGIPTDNLNNFYWVELPNNKEYPFKYLTKTAYSIASGEKLRFQSNESYRSYVRDLGIEINYYKEGYPFISEKEIEHFQKNAGKAYRAANPENERDGILLRPLVKKINYWAEKAAVGSFISKTDNYWQWSGTFKTYLWVRVYRSGDSGKIFFIVGVNDDGTLFYKIDCQRSNHTMGSTKPLSQEKINLIDSYLAKTGLKKGGTNKYDGEKTIDKSELIHYDWNRLIEEVRDFITTNIPVYEDLEQIVTEDIGEEITRDSLSRKEKPVSINSRIPQKRQYTGQVTDWTNQHKTSILLGESGEKLVIQLEREKLIKAGLFEKAEMVCKELDGKGYDITSFNEAGEEIHIEVKTTKGASNQPFYMSLNERDYFHEFPKNYFLFRLYNYNFTSNSAQYFVLNADELKECHFRAMNFEISI